MKRLVAPLFRRYFDLMTLRAVKALKDRRVSFTFTAQPPGDSILPERTPHMARVQISEYGRGDESISGGCQMTDSPQRMSERDQTDESVRLEREQAKVSSETSWTWRALKWACLR